MLIFILLPPRKVYCIYGERDLNTPTGIFFFLRLDLIQIIACFLKVFKVKFNKMPMIPLLS